MIASFLLRSAGSMMYAAEVPDPEGDARRLLEHALGITSGRMMLHLGDDISESDQTKFLELVSQRLSRIPVSQIVGGRWFYDHWFTVTSDVLDPRPDTETLVECALARPFENVLDLGLGSGCILLTLLSKTPLSRGVGSDISQKALKIAKQNADALGVLDRAEIICSDWFENIQGKFDLIVSNPPYIRADEMAELAPEVRDHEPHFALTPGGDGLAAYRIITGAAGTHLVPGGRLIVEIGPSQGQVVRELFERAGFIRVTLIQDLDGRDRVVQGEIPD